MSSIEMTVPGSLIARSPQEAFVEAHYTAPFEDRRAGMYSLLDAGEISEENLPAFQGAMDQLNLLQNQYADLAQREMQQGMPDADRIARAQLAAEFIAASRTRAFLES